MRELRITSDEVTGQVIKQAVIPDLPRHNCGFWCAGYSPDNETDYRRLLAAESFVALRVQARSYNLPVAMPVSLPSQ